MPGSAILPMRRAYFLPGRVPQVAFLYRARRVDDARYLAHAAASIRRRHIEKRRRTPPTLAPLLLAASRREAATL